MNGLHGIISRAAIIAVLAVACSRAADRQDDSAVAATVGAAGAAPAPSQGAPSPIPPVIDSIGTHGEDLYDAIAAGNWTKAKQLADLLRADLNQVPRMSRDAGSSLVGLVDSTTQAIAAKQRHTGLVTANEITRVAAEMTRAFTTATPVEVLLLDYYGRELEIWSAVSDTTRLRSTTAAVRKAWDLVKPAVLAKKGSATAAKMDGIVATLEKASTPAQWKAAAKPLLDQVDELEKVFTGQ
jgi:hypothetical protein